MTRIVLAFAAGAICGLVSMWPGRTPIAAPALPQARHVARASAGPDGLKPVLRFAFASRSADGAHRNLFAFPEAPKPRAPEPVPVVAPAPVVIATPQPMEPAPPPFPYRYLGTFGPREAPFAVFARDGEVLNVRAGEAIGAGFRLVRIGIESVEIADGGGTRRIIP